MAFPARWRAMLSWGAACLMLAALSGCGSPPRKSGASGPVVLRPGAAPSSERDGADAHPPPDLAGVPDAQPRVEPIRKGGPNKPYEALGRDYVPLTDDQPFTERGLASWYGRKFHGRATASGEPYDMYAMTAAHPTLPIPSYVRVSNPANGREVVVRINDRGPFHPGRIIDLSYAAAYKLGVLQRVSPVELTRITFEEIRAGSWRKTPGPGDDGPRRDAAELAAHPPAPSVPPPRQPLRQPTRTEVAADDAIAAIAADTGTPTPAPGTQTEPPPSPAATASDARAGAGFWVQIGVFRQREGAEGFHRRVAADLDWLAPLLGVFSESPGYRLQAGPYASRDQAQGVARRVREALKLVPVVVERR